MVSVLHLQEILQLCARRKFVNGGKTCHALALQVGLLYDTFTCNILINFYSKCGHVDLARCVFDRMHIRSMVSWNTMIAAHIHHGEDREALKLFVHMRQVASVTEFTLSSVLCACAAKCALVESEQLHGLALKTALSFNVFVATAILDVYAKWYVQNDLHEEALSFFHYAQNTGVEITQFTLSAVLSSCASIAAVVEGTQIHSLLVRTGFESDIYVATSLINAYSKCGRVDDAYLVFRNMENKNIVLWNAMIAGFSRHARPHEAMILFEKMQQAGVLPNEVTYVSVLSACSHVGFVERGRHYFDLMISDCLLQPNVLHYACMVDILGRAGMVNEAWELIQRMPFNPTSSMWGSILNSCRIYGRLELAEIAAQLLFKLEPNNAANHVLLSNIYAANKHWGEVAISRKLLKDSGAKKEIGKSWIEVKHDVHIFVVGDFKHPRFSEIYDKVRDLTKEMKKLAYKTEIEHDLHDVSHDQKEELLQYHSERLALAFGLITLPDGVPIRIYKNLRVCGDCHSFMKLASRITDREIIARDTNRFHHFRDGYCSCGDFW